MFKYKFYCSLVFDLIDNRENDTNTTDAYNYIDE